VNRLAIIIAGIMVLLSTPVVLELAMFLVANVLLRPVRRRGPGYELPLRDRLRIAILIPAHDEEKNIARCVSSILASDQGGCEREIIVIADNCGDRTAAIAGATGARVIERHDDAVRGKGAAIRYALDQLSPEAHDAYIIIDADTIVSRNFIQIMAGYFAGGAQAIQSVNLPLNTEASPRVRLMNLALLSMNVFKPVGRGILGFSAGILGNGFGLGRKLLENVPYTANSIAEDLEYHLRLVEKGYKVRFVPETRVWSDFPVSRQGTETQRARWEGGRFKLQRQKFLPMLGMMASGKTRMLEPFLELMSMPLSYTALMLCAIAVIPAQPFPVFGISGLAIILAQMIASVVLYGERKDFLAFFEIPAYLFWKIARLPAILRNSRKNAEWIRTKRD